MMTPAETIREWTDETARETRARAANPAGDLDAELEQLFAFSQRFADRTTVACNSHIQGGC